MKALTGGFNLILNERQSFVTIKYQLLHLLLCPDTLTLLASSLEHREILVDAKTYFETVFEIKG